MSTSFVATETVPTGPNLAPSGMQGQEITGPGPITVSAAFTHASTVGHRVRASIEVRRNTLAAGDAARLQLVGYPLNWPTTPSVVVATSPLVSPLEVGEWVRLEADGVVPPGLSALQMELRLQGSAVSDHSTRYARVVDLDTASHGLPLRLEVETDPAPGVLVNLIDNPSGDQGGFGWVTSVPQSSIVATAGEPLSRYQRALRYITGETTGSLSNYFYSDQFPVTAGQYLTARWNVEYAIHGRYRVWFYFYNSAGVFLSQSAYTNFTASYAEAASPNFQAPANTAYAAFGFEVGTATGAYPYTKGGESFYVRNVRVCKAATTAALTTAAVSAAIATPYLDILGPTHEIRADRKELDLGQLQATVLDAALDPSEADTIRAGKRLRLRGWSIESGQYENLWSGEVLKANVAYDAKRADDPKHARIQLTGVDPLQKLANAQRPEGVDTIAQLPFILEGAGVPWVCDGNSSQIAAADKASTNENATAADQVALTRDTNLGYAWIDPNGVLQAWSALPDPDQELTTNGRFDVNTSGWFPNGIGGTPTLARDTAQKPAGFTASARLTTVANLTSYWINTINTANSNRGAIPVTPGREYVISGWFRSSAANRWPTLIVDWWNRGGNIPTFISTSGGDYNVPTSAVLTANTWTRVTKRVVAPAGARAADLWAGASLQSGTTTAGQQFWITGLTMKPVADVAVLDETSYSQLGIDFDTERCINSVSMKWLLHNTDTLATDEYALGPYEDEASIKEWGRHHREFTITGRAANAAALAASVFARNGTPQVQPSAVTIPIRDVSDLRSVRAFLDLYDLVRVVHAGKGLDYRARVSSITHRITPKGWHVELAFAPVASVAIPQQQPTLQSPGNAGPPHLRALYSLATGSVGAAYVALPDWTVIESSQIGRSGAAFHVQRPGRYRVTCTAVWNNSGAVGELRLVRINVNGTVTPYSVRPGQGAGAFVDVEKSQVVRLAANEWVAMEVYSSALCNLLGGTAGHGLTRIEIEFLGD